ncbi:hypothetical protein GCM10011356_16580 [Kangiella profundi]|nr:hypothetical protein GCM10011356_16580 [Kangiella profundi]
MTIKKIPAITALNNAVNIIGAYGKLREISGKHVAHNTMVNTAPIVANTLGRMG